ERNVGGEDLLHAGDAAGLAPGPHMRHRYAEALVEKVRDQRAVAGLRVGLDAEQRARRLGQVGDDRVEVGAVEDLARVALDVGGREPRARALALTAPRVLFVLEVAKLGRGGELRVVAIR